MKPERTTCPVCGTDERVIIDLFSRVRYHICPASLTEIFWLGSLFTNDPNKLPVALTT